ncbi:MAG: transposase, partial [Candidatus Atribacteria bacterium]|nr:transposase [Candidatus Atribacteria bacterium]
SRIYEKYHCNILPIAIFTYDQVRDEPDALAKGFSFLDDFLFRFYKLELKKLSWLEYLHRDNPVAAALLSKMGFTEKEKVRVKLEFLRLLVRLKLDPARQELITGFFETYLVLSPKEEEQFNQALGQINQQEAESIMEITTSWHKKGKIEGKIDYICKFMVRRFNADPDETMPQLKQISSLEVLDNLMEELFAVNTIEEARAIMERNLSRARL